MAIPSRPAFLTGTSSEFLGKRALPKILGERKICFLLGPSGSGKTSVALRLGQPATYRDRAKLEEVLLQRVRTRAWPAAEREAPNLILDGPVWLQNRPAIVRVLGELLRQRSEAGLRTLVCQPDHDGSVNLLMDQVGPGQSVVLALRFPKGKRGRLRFATRQCERLQISKMAAKGSEAIEPWGYAQVVAHLEEWARNNA